MSCGQSHTVLVTAKGTCFTWGHVADGRLGVGTNKRLGVREPENRYFPTPTLVAGIKNEVVTQVGSPYPCSGVRGGLACRLDDALE